MSVDKPFFELKKRTAAECGLAPLDNKNNIIGDSKAGENTNNVNDYFVEKREGTIKKVIDNQETLTDLSYDQIGKMIQEAQQMSNMASKSKDKLEDKLEKTPIKSANKIESHLAQNLNNENLVRSSITTKVINTSGVKNFPSETEKEVEKSQAKNDISADEIKEVPQKEIKPVSATTWGNSTVENKNPFLGAFSKPSGSSTTENPFLPLPKNQNVFTNPFLQFQTKNANSVFNTNTTNKPMFNFNLNVGASSALDSDKEDDGPLPDSENPELEVAIEPKSSNIVTGAPIPKSTNVKILKMNLENVYQYDIKQTKFINKGKNDVYLELSKNADGNDIIAFVILRNSLGNIILQAQILKDKTKMELNLTNRGSATIKGLIYKGKDKLEVTHVKLPFCSDANATKFKESYDEVMRILNEKDMKIFDN